MTFLGELMYEWTEMGPRFETVITTVLHFDKVVDRKLVEAIIHERLLVFDRFRSIVKLNARSHTHKWTPLERVKMGYHLVEHRLPPPGTRKELEAFISRAYSEPLDPNHPLWRFYIVPLAGHKCAVVTRIHHSVGDGVTLVQVMLSLMGRAEAKKQPRVMKKRRPVSWVQTLANPLRFSSRCFQFAAGVAKGFAYPLRPQDTPNPLKIPSIAQLTTGRRVACGTSIPLQLFKTAGKRMDGTINDMIVATLTATLRRYLLTHDARLFADGTKAPRISVLFPFNMRYGRIDVSDPKQFGNQFTLLPLDLPIHERDPIRIMLAAKQCCDEIKESPMAFIITALNKLAMTLLPAKWYHALTFACLEKSTGMFTNVPGPKKPMLLAGQVVTDLMFYVPALASCTFSVMSYDGSVRFGVMTNQGGKLDPNELTSFFHEEFHRLHDASKGLQPRVRRPEASPWNWALLFVFVILLSRWKYLFISYAAATCIAWLLSSSRAF